MNLVAGLLAPLAFILLRVEALLGGRGDRFVHGNPIALLAAPWVLTFVSGGLLVEAADRALPVHAALLGVLPNLVLFVNYVVVGVLVRRTQLARRPLLGGWSLSGVAMAGMFPSCGVSHLAAGLTVRPDLHMLLFDLHGVPASLFFLWVVSRVHADSLAGWNRRALVGRAAATSRRSPWAAAEPA